MHGEFLEIRHMRTICGLFLLSFIGASSGLTQTTSGGQLLAPTGYSCVQRGPHSRVWQRNILTTNEMGLAKTSLQSYTELCTGVCYQNNGAWIDSVEQINPVAGGAEAVQGPHQVHWALNANTPSGAVTVSTPDGKQLSSTVFGLAYFDTSNGSNAAISLLRNCNGALMGSNQVIYSDAFSNLTADVCYTYTKAGLSQDVVLRQAPPAPHQFGLFDESSVLQIYTEFFNTPDPNAMAVTNGNTIDQQVLSFGDMNMGIGQALFLTGHDAPISAGTVAKRWIHVNNRTFLIESVPYRAISNRLQQLPQASNLTTHKGSIGRTALLDLRSAKPDGPGKSVKPMKFAKAEGNHPRLVMDYDLLSSSDEITLQGDTTYLVSGPVDCNLLTIEGGAVIKYTNSGSAEIFVSSYGSNFICQTGPYRMACFTSMNDDSVGTIISGSTGIPTVSSTYLGFTLQSTQSFTLKNLRFSYATTAISGQVVYNSMDEDSIKVWDCQFYDCGTAIDCNVQLESLILYIYNVLLSDVTTGVRKDDASDGTLSTVEVNVTADDMEILGGGDFSSAINSIFTRVYSLGATSLSNCFTGSGTGTYQVVGAGGYYLAAGSPYRNAGTTNIDPALLTDLQSLTTYPPVTTVSVWFTTNYTFFPQAQRDTDAVDLGYHYEPVDYLFYLAISNATATVLPGTVIAACGPQYGAYLYSGAALNCAGTASSPVWIVRYNTVQEQSNTNFETTSWVASVITPDGGGGAASSANFQFVNWSALADDGIFAGEYYSMNPVLFENCQFYNGQFNTLEPSLLVTNCLFQRMSTSLNDLSSGSGLNLAFVNNLFWQGELFYSHSYNIPWAFRDNFFDMAAISVGRHSTLPIDICSNNAYVTTNYGIMLSENNDIILSAAPVFQTSFLGQYYYPTSLSLSHAGSELASAANLYHYTVTTNNIIEGTNTVSIGFHYVATNTKGVPLDANGDGIPDYLEDANGNGVVDPGEIDWQVAGDLGLTVVITQPVNNSSAP